MSPLAEVAHVRPGMVDSYFATEEVLAYGRELERLDMHIRWRPSSAQDAPSRMRSAQAKFVANVMALGPEEKG